MESIEHSLLRTAIARLEQFESESIARLSRLEENLRLLRQDLVGDGQPGRISRLESDVGVLRAQHHHQRGMWAAITFLVSLTVTLAARLFHR